MMDVDPWNKLLDHVQRIDDRQKAMHMALCATMAFTAVQNPNLVAQLEEFLKGQPSVLATANDEYNHGASINDELRAIVDMVKDILKSSL